MGISHPIENYTHALNSLYRAQSAESMESAYTALQHSPQEDNQPTQGTHREDKDGHGPGRQPNQETLKQTLARIRSAAEGREDCKEE